MNASEQPQIKRLRKISEPIAKLLGVERDPKFDGSYWQIVYEVTGGHTLSFTAPTTTHIRCGATLERSLQTFSPHPLSWECQFAATRAPEDVVKEIIKKVLNPLAASAEKAIFNRGEQNAQNAKRHKTVKGIIEPFTHVPKAEISQVVPTKVFISIKGGIKVALNLRGENDVSLVTTNLTVSQASAVIRLLAGKNCVTLNQQ